MEEAGFPHDDALYLKVCAAYDAMHRLSVDVHYLSCDGVGERARDKPPQSFEAAAPDGPGGQQIPDITSRETRP